MNEYWIVKVLCTSSEWVADKSPGGTVFYIEGYQLQGSFSQKLVLDRSSAFRFNSRAFARRIAKLYNDVPEKAASVVHVKVNSSSAKFKELDARYKAAVSELTQLRNTATRACDHLYHCGATRGDIETRARVTLEAYDELLDEKVELEARCERLLAGARRCRDWWRKTSAELQVLRQRVDESLFMSPDEIDELLVERDELEDRCRKLLAGASRCRDGWQQSLAELKAWNVSAVARGSSSEPYAAVHVGDEIRFPIMDSCFHKGPVREADVPEKCEEPGHREASSSDNSVPDRLRWNVSKNQFETSENGGPFRRAHDLHDRVALERPKSSVVVLAYGLHEAKEKIEALETALSSCKSPGACQVCRFYKSKTGACPCPEKAKEGWYCGDFKETF